MRYCPNCGNKVNNGQLFCNHCGYNFKENIHGYSRSNSSNIRKNKQTNNKKSWFLPLIIVILVLLSVSLIVFYYFYNQKDDISQSKKSHNEVNVLSTQFSENFMNQDNTDGYDGFELGMSAKEIKRTFGKEDGTITLSIGKVYKYGNIGIYYGSDNAVSSVYILPSNITVDEFKNVHGEPTIQTDEQMVYDDNPDNGFTIFISHNGDEIISIENTYQIDNSSLENMKKLDENSDSMSSSFTIDALNYSNGIGKIIDTAFNSEDFTELDDSLSDAQSMVDNWDSLLENIESQARTPTEQDVVNQLQNFKEDRDSILEDLEEFVDNHNSQAWKDAQKNEVYLKQELVIFGDELQKQ